MKQNKFLVPRNLFCLKKSDVHAAGFQHEGVPPQTSPSFCGDGYLKYNFQYFCHIFLLIKNFIITLKFDLNKKVYFATPPLLPIRFYSVAYRVCKEIAQLSRIHRSVLTQQPFTDYGYCTVGIQADEHFIVGDISKKGKQLFA